MGLFSKKKEEVPSLRTSQPLPELPSLPPLEPEKKNLPELPTLPSSPKTESFNQEMVKSAVSDVPSSEEKEVISKPPMAIAKKQEEKDFPKLPSAPKPPVLEFPKQTEKPVVSTPQSPQPTIPESHPAKTIEPIFVRIDKFQAAQKDFDEIKSKALEIEEVLKKIKEVKAKEDEELKNWTEDIEKLKNQLAEVDNNIFNQL